MSDLEEEVNAHYREITGSNVNPPGCIVSLLNTASQYLHDREGIFDYGDPAQFDPCAQEAFDISYGASPLEDGGFLYYGNMAMPGCGQFDDTLPDFQNDPDFPRFTPINPPIAGAQNSQYAPHNAYSGHLADAQASNGYEHRFHPDVHPDDSDFDDGMMQPRAKRARFEEPERYDEILEDYLENDMGVGEEVEEGEALPKLPATPKKSPVKRSVKASYGSTPFPDYPHPTPEEVREVFNILTEEHGVQIRPEKLVASLTFTGCGEVPTVLDAVLRTVISANTSTASSCSTLVRLVETFGVKHETLNWDAIYDASEEAVYEVMAKGGLGKIKTKQIKGILAIAKKECEELGTNELSLEHVRDLDTAEAMKKLQSLPGVGVKVAACVVLYCLQRPALAIDTHCHHMARLLKWIPPNADADKTFFHLDATVPDEYKYALHQLFMAHGQTCKPCNAASLTLRANQELEAERPEGEVKKKKSSTKKTATDEVAETSARTTCVLENLVDRQIFIDMQKAKKVAKKAKKEKTGELENGEESHESETNHIDGEAEATSKPKPTKRKRSTKKEVKIEDDLGSMSTEGALDSSPIKIKPKATPKSRKPTIKKDTNPESLETMEGAFVSSPIKPKAKAAPRPKKAVIKKDIDDEETPKPKKVKAAPKAALPKVEAEPNDTDDSLANLSTEEEAANPKPKKVSAKAKATPKTTPKATLTASTKATPNTTTKLAPKSAPKAPAIKSSPGLNGTASTTPSLPSSQLSTPTKITLGPKKKKAVVLPPVIEETEQDGI